MLWGVAGWHSIIKISHKKKEPNRKCPERKCIKFVYLVLHKKLTIYLSTHGIMVLCGFAGWLFVSAALAWSLYFVCLLDLQLFFVLFCFVLFLCVYMRKSSACGWIAESHM